MRLFLLVSLFFFVNSLAFGQQEHYSKLRVYLDGRSAQDLMQLGVTCDHGEHRKSVHFESDFSRADRRLLESSGFRYDVLIEDVVAYYENQNKVGTARTANCAPTGGLSAYAPPANFALGTMGGYLTYQQMLDNLDSMASKYPNLITTKTVIDPTNLTHENRPIYWLKISDNPNVDENEPEALYTAVHHAREPLALSQLIYYMWYLLENYDTDAEIQYLLENTELYFLPCLNPDGYVYNESTNPNGGGMWRKNRRNNGGSYGVDLNRNYGYAFAHDNIGSSGSPTSDTYRGTAAFSEPETQNMRDFCNAHDFTFAFNYHTYGNLLIYPWAYNDQLTPDSTEYRAYAGVMTKENNYAYGTNMETIGYSTNGDADDWFYGEQTTKNKILTMTPEASSGGFWPAASTIVGNCQGTMWQNLAMAHLLLIYGEAVEKSAPLVPQINAQANFDLTHYGMMSGALTVRLTPLSSNIVSVGAAKVFNLAQFATVEDSIALNLDPSIANGARVRYVLTVDNGFYTQNDTIERMYGSYVLAFSEDGNSLNNWTNQGANSNWEVTTTDYYSPTGSLTDSRVGNYGNNETSEIILNQSFDLSGATEARLDFWAKWDIEANYDYVQVMAAGSSGVYQALCGLYTDIGTNNQDVNEPLYDGTQATWVAESMSLNDFLGEPVVRIKLRLVTDNWVDEDGFYFDDFKVSILGATVGTQQIALDNRLELGQNQPNPADLKVYIPLEIPSDVDEQITLQISNALGQKRHAVVLGKQQNGVEVVVENWAEGVYIYQLIGANYRSEPRRMVVVK
ncbi:MAG: Carboxypeptidase T precursor (EC [uncultured Aureispira sp.]|uniref:carboxypeptidase T n=1 Tax=uncultured Aureispira sp. TaxID=1331704 RepID=A0A6S6S5M1_9BACT|nr:MAG: Carboxypeptidase T precursor (EC [uncultured Aureispira sp.]